MEVLGGVEPFYMEGAEEVIPRPLRLVDLAREDWREGYVQTTCACLSQAAELHLLAGRASPEVRPLLQADSARLLYTFLMRSVSRMERVPGSLGVLVTLERGPPPSVIIEVDPYGPFPTLAITLAALEHPSAFTPYIPDVETYREERWTVYEQRTDLSVEKTVRMGLDDLVAYDFETDARSQTMKWVVEDFQSRYVQTSRMLRDLLVTAAAAEMARREPAAWKQVLRGETTEMGRHVDRAHAGLRDAVRTVAEVLTSIEAGERSAYVATGYHFV